MKNTLLTALLLLVSGCSTLGLPGNDFWSYNPQNYQGCTVGEYDNESGTRVRWWDCKDKALVKGSVDLNADGTPDFTYDASDIVGSSAAQIRADVEKAFADSGVEILPSVVSEIVNSLTP